MLTDLQEQKVVYYKTCFPQGALLWPFILITIIVGYIFASFYLAGKYWIKRDLFPLKARAPL